jgi:integrase
MASIYRPKGSKKYVIMYFDENGRRRKKTGTTDKVVTKRIAHDIDNKVALRRAGSIDPAAERFAESERTPLVEHIAAWEANLVAEGRTVEYAEQITGRVRRLVAVILGSNVARLDPRRLSTSERGEVSQSIEAAIKPARLSDLTRLKVQAAIAKLKDAGRSHRTCNHYRTAAKIFVRWCKRNDRIRENPLDGVTGYNVKEDIRHDRRTISLDELRRLIVAAERGPVIRNLPGPTRALCYRLAVATGLRYSEIASIKPESFNWKAPSVTVAAAYTKNGDPATLPIPNDLVDDLAAFVAPLPSGTPVFPLPNKKGSDMVRRDLKAAGIPYCDDAGLVFDFHALRCETATLADAAGVTPRVVQKLMRHSSLELTGKYTRPRAVDINAAASLLPSLKPEKDRPEALAMTGTDPSPAATQNATSAIADESNSNHGKLVASIGQGTAHPDPRPDRARHAGRPGTLSGGRFRRLPGQADPPGRPPGRSRGAGTSRPDGPNGETAPGPGASGAGRVECPLRRG